MTALSIEALQFGFADADKVVNDFHLQAESGEIICLLGASGCGKTTVLNLIAGLLKPSGGKIELSTRKSAAETGIDVGYIFQNDALFPWRTVEGNLLLASDLNPALSKAQALDKMGQYLDVFHLSKSVLKKFPSQLSGGMRQRVSIIQTLMFEPELILLDEPFSALDYYTKLSLEEEFCQLVRSQGKTAILVTHDIEEAVAMADRAYIMNGGKLEREFVIRAPHQEESRSTATNEARGSSVFAEHYRLIWKELKQVVGSKD